jgi:transcriptional antiterminator NusG
MKNWYIVQSHSSFENKVAKIIKDEAEKAKISEKFEEIVVPTQDVTEVKRGKRVQRKKKYFPGYVLIKSEMDNDIYHMIKGIKKVSGFLGARGLPSPVSDNEIEKILGQIKDGVTQVQTGIEYSVGEKVQVIDGPFASFNGLVEDVDEDKSKLKVSVLIFGRPTPVELEFNQVEKVS